MPVCRNGRNVELNEQGAIGKMTNTNQQTNTEKRKHATLWTISGTLDRLRYLTDTAINGTILDYPDKDGNEPPANGKSKYWLFIKNIEPMRIIYRWWINKSFATSTRARGYAQVWALAKEGRFKNELRKRDTKRICESLCPNG